MKAFLALFLLWSSCICAMERFHIFEGGQHNYFLRDADITAHLLLKGGPRPRLIVAFPEENSGIAIWLDTKLDLVSKDALFPFRRGHLRGIRFNVRGHGNVEVKKILLNNIRVLRDFAHLARCPQDREIAKFIGRIESFDAQRVKQIEQCGVSIEAVYRWLEPEIKKTPHGIEWRRPTLDGKNHYFLGIYPKTGTIDAGPPCRMHFKENDTVFEIVVAVDFPAYSPVSADMILNDRKQNQLARLANEDPQLHRRIESMLRNLSFLSYREKVMAGSWRFLTYFGRDSIMSLRMLQSVVRPEFYRDVMIAVLMRVNCRGEVAHEEDIGDQAAWRRIVEFNRACDRDFTKALGALEDFSAPIYDYKMIDDNFMLPIMIAEYLANPMISASQKTDFLQSKIAPGQTALDKILLNADYVLGQCNGKSIALKNGESVGDWRDSGSGLAYGRYPFSVNGALAPLSLYALEKILRTVSPEQALALAKRKDLKSLARVLENDELPGIQRTWENARQEYLVCFTAPEVRAFAQKYCRYLGFPQLPQTGKLRFYALALDRNQRPIPVMHSDTAFLLFQSFYVPKDLEILLAPFQSPFPLGLWTEAGPLVANPVCCPEKFYQIFDKRHYHGSVIWSWHISLLELGLIKQYRMLYEHWREDGDNDSLHRMGMIKKLLLRLFELEPRIAEFRASELWSWQFSNGKLQPVAYGSGKDLTESNALQLWSCVTLAAWLEYRSILPLLEKIE